jgi:hypothetical protein
MIIDKLKMWLRATFPSLLNTDGTPKFQVLQTSAEVPEEASPMTKLVMVAGVILPLGILIVILFFVGRFLFKAITKKRVRRRRKRPGTVRRIVSRVRRSVSGSKGSTAMQRRMAKVRAAKRKRTPKRKK